MQSHNLQHAPARYVLHFFQIFKEQTPTNDITYMSIKKSAMKTRPAGHHHDLLLVSVPLGGYHSGAPAVVELVGIEPTTYGLQSRRSPS